MSSKDNLISSMDNRTEITLNRKEHGYLFQLTSVTGNSS